MKAHILPRANELMETLYTELRALARARMRRLAPGQTLQPTDLVHEAYMRLAREPDKDWNGRRHFFGAAAMAMRDIVVDHARSKRAMRRGGAHVRVDWTMTIADRELPLTAAEVMTLHTALERLQALHPEHAEVVLLHCFAGLPIPEVAEVMGASQRSVERRWRFARAWLHVQMQEP